MLCRKPFTKKGVSFGCGQCLFCRINRRRLWAHRIMLEAVVHPSASFVTLTYNDEKLPDGGSLEASHLSAFMKRLRKNTYPHKCRFFGVGEYGDFSERPHYHLALFGFDRTHQSELERAWTDPEDKGPFGFVDVQDLTFDSANYIAGYVTKKLTDKDDPRLQGREPEFARMSRRPGIGALSILQISEAIRSHPAGWPEISRKGDVPLSLRHGRKNMPLGRYLRMKLRQELGIDPEEVVDKDHRFETFKKSSQVLSLYQDWLVNREGPSPYVVEKQKEEQRRINKETRFKIKQRNKL